MHFGEKLQPHCFINLAPDGVSGQFKAPVLIREEAIWAPNQSALYAEEKKYLNSASN
jgi:hypothetical protein